MNIKEYFSEKNYNQRIIGDIFPTNSNRTSMTAFIRVLDEIDSPIYFVDRNTRLCFFNKNYYETYGLMLSDYFSVPLERYIEKLLGIILKNLASLESDPLIQAMETNRTILKKAFEGNEKHISNIYPISQDNTVVGAMIFSQDMSSIIHLNQEIIKYKTLSQSLKNEISSKEVLPPAFQGVIGSSETFFNILRIAARVAPTKAAVCLSGESGTGKEVMAKAIHESSDRFHGPLVRVNCAAIPESLIESELFGYEKGAFTGANHNGKPGKFELAHNGTLFLDEIGEMPLAMQVKLLRALQEQEITRVGGIKPIKINFRLITATNRNLEAMVAEGTFREDLFYRINVINLNLPPLRERRQDIPLLINHFLDEMHGIYGKEVHIANDTLSMMTNYDWPGNIRELKNCIERMVVMCLGDTLEPDLLPPQFWKASNQNIIFQSESLKLQPLIDRVERDAIIKALSLTGGNKSKAIEMLGISKRSFYMKLEKYNIH